MSRPSIDSRLNLAPLAIQKPLDPPLTCTAAQREVWLGCVQTKPADWFRADSEPMLLEYVRAVVMSGELERRIQAAIDEGEFLINLRTLLEMRDKESKRVAMLATKLRLTQQSRYTPDSAATATKRTVARPWHERVAV